MYTTLISEFETGFWKERRAKRERLIYSIATELLLLVGWPARTVDYTNNIFWLTGKNDFEKVAQRRHSAAAGPSPPLPSASNLATVSGGGICSGDNRRIRICFRWPSGHFLRP